VTERELVYLFILACALAVYVAYTTIAIAEVAPHRLPPSWIRRASAAFPNARVGSRAAALGAATFALITQLVPLAVGITTVSPVERLGSVLELALAGAWTLVLVRQWRMNGEERTGGT
jgi:hypothetical protein